MEKSLHNELPYEKFMQKGAESLTDAELLAILLRTGPVPDKDAPRAHKECPALALAERILELPVGTQRGLSGLSQLSPAQLQTVKGIGEVKAVRICCIFEMAKRIAMGQRSRLPAFPDPEAVAAYCRPLFSGESVEKTLLLLLDAKGRLIHERVLSIGTVNSAPVSPREVFLQALKYQAVFFLLLHNHPSGDVSPSREDAELTKKLAGLGEMMQLELLDHIIISGQEHFSFKRAGLL